MSQGSGLHQPLKLLHRVPSTAAPAKTLPGSREGPSHRGYQEAPRNHQVFPLRDSFVMVSSYWASDPSPQHHLFLLSVPSSTLLLRGPRLTSPSTAHSHQSQNTCHSRQQGGPPTTDLTVQCHLFIAGLVLSNEQSIASCGFWPITGLSCPPGFIPASGHRMSFHPHKLHQRTIYQLPSLHRYWHSITNPPPTSSSSS